MTFADFSTSEMLSKLGFVFLSFRCKSRYPTELISVYSTIEMKLVILVVVLLCYSVAALSLYEVLSDRLEQTSEWEECKQCVPRCQTELNPLRALNCVDKCTEKCGRAVKKPFIGGLLTDKRKELLAEMLADEEYKTNSYARVEIDTN